ncbi:hypothetical protein P4S73_29860 [Paraglaciecola sp. Hal342]
MTSEAYVFIDGLEDTPVICGVTRIKDNGKPGQFRYGKSYLGRPDAFPLDPLTFHSAMRFLVPRLGMVYSAL